jgi:hypothetical protein
MVRKIGRVSLTGMAMAKPQSEDEKKLDAVLKRMLNTPHKPHKPIKAAKKKAEPGVRPKSKKSGT